jgi:CRP/FNR family transcriptional regulator
MGVFSGGDRHCLLERMPAFQQLPDQTRQHLRRICSVHHLSTGETLAHQGDPVQGVYFVRKGLLRMQKQLVDGRVQIVGLLATDHMVGTVFVEKHAFSVEAVAPTEVISFDAAQFRNLVGSTPELEQILLRGFQDEVDATLNWLLLVSCSKVRARLAGFLLILMSRYSDIPNLVDERDETLSLRIPISRIDLSNILAVRPESLSRAFHALADDGLIDVIKHDHVRIVDIDGLSMEVGDPDFFGSEPDDNVGIRGKKSLWR